jgi:hypothetical protein
MKTIHIVNNELTLASKLKLILNVEQVEIRIRGEVKWC